MQECDSDAVEITGESHVVPHSLKVSNFHTLCSNRGYNIVMHYTYSLTPTLVLRFLLVVSRYDHIKSLSLCYQISAVYVCFITIK